MIGFKMIYKLSHSGHIVLSVEGIGTFNEKTFYSWSFLKVDKEREKKNERYRACRENSRLKRRAVFQPALFERRSENIYYVKNIQFLLLLTEFDTKIEKLFFYQISYIYFNVCYKNLLVYQSKNIQRVIKGFLVRVPIGQSYSENCDRKLNFYSTYSHNFLIHLKVNQSQSQFGVGIWQGVFLS